MDAFGKFHPFLFIILRKTLNLWFKLVLCLSAHYSCSPRAQGLNLHYNTCIYLTHSAFVVFEIIFLRIPSLTYELDGP